MNFQRIENLDAKGRRVFVRVDLNFTESSGLDKESPKIVKILPTLELLLRKGAKIILVSHLESSNDRADLILSILNQIFPTIKLAKGQNPKDWVTETQALNEGDILFIPSINTNIEESQNSKEFSRELSNIADIYINEAFSQSSKVLSSTVGITEFLPSYVGTYFYREVEILSSLISRPDKPYIAIIGGPKVSSKIKLLNSLLNRANSIIIAGGIAYTFLKARAVPVGSSVIEKEFEVLSHQFIDKAGIAGVDFQMPVDHVIADNLGDRAKTKNVDRMGIVDGWMGVDIGPKTISTFEKIFKNAGTIFWTGPVGVMEIDKFSQGSISLAKSISKTNAKIIISGDHTISAVKKAGVESKITHISLGADSTLEFLEGKTLPALKALNKEKED